MKSLNKVTLLGNLGKDPEVRYTASGKAVATFSMATTFSWKNQNGEYQEQTEWHRIVAWGRLGEICGEYLKKGDKAYIEGRLQTREWEDRDGNKRQTTEIIANDMIMLSNKEGGDDKGQQRQNGGGSQRQSDSQQNRQTSGGQGGGSSRGANYPPPPHDNIPF